MIRWAFMILLLFCLRSQAQTTAAVSNAVLQSLDGKNTKIETAANLATVVVFLLPDCPASQNYTLTLNQFSEKYKEQRITFFGVFPPFVKRAEIIQFQKEYKINFPLLMDIKQSLMNALQAHVAPGVFVVDQQNTVIYSGRIDDWMYAIGKKRAMITHHELQNALDAIVQGKKVAVSKTQAVGCIID